jgi:hypothetical protein
MRGRFDEEEESNEKKAMEWRRGELRISRKCISWNLARAWLSFAMNIFLFSLSLSSR